MGGEGGGGGSAPGVLSAPRICPHKFTHCIHTSALAAGLVHNLVDDVAAGLVVLLAEDDGGDLDQEALQLGPERGGRGLEGAAAQAGFSAKSHIHQEDLQLGPEGGGGEFRRHGV